MHNFEIKIIPKQLKTINLTTILIFDSGVGGLSIYHKVKQLLPDLHYIYVFDNDAFPYGEKESEFIIKRVFHIINLVQQKHKLAVAIIACNTASIVSLPILRAYFQFPIIGVVPAIKTATKLTRNGIIGLIATRATINGKYTKDLINRFAAGCKVKMIASSELVELAERKVYGQLISKEILACILKPWLKTKESPDTIVLGCTHFQLLRTKFKEVLSNKIKLIDSSAAIAKRAFWLINNHTNYFSVKTNVDVINNNITYCTKKDINSEKLLPVLRNEGFNQLEKISI